MRSDEILYAWIFLPGCAAPVIAGRLTVEGGAGGHVGAFVYGQSYLERSDAIALDPVTVPLHAGEFRITTLRGYPGVFLDACPDRWGIKVIDRLKGKQEYPGGYLLLNDPGRAGSLCFSGSASEPPVELASRQFSVEALVEAAERLECDRDVDPELLRALHPGTGGARPKCNVVDTQGVWIAKFPAVDDDSRISIPRLEHAAMRLGAACGIRTAETRCESIGGKDVCFVKRFDRTRHADWIERHGYLSARTVFYADPGFASLGTGSYGRLASWMGRYGCAAEERLELFRRMVFNCAIRNTDDHEQNHGLVHVQDNRFRLAEAFDVLPSLSSHRIHRHALLIGDSAAGTIDNLLGNGRAFGIDREQGLAIIHEVQSCIQAHWRDVFYEAGFGDAELHRIEPSLHPLPERDSKA